MPGFTVLFVRLQEGQKPKTCPSHGHPPGHLPLCPFEAHTTLYEIYSLFAVLLLRDQYPHQRSIAIYGSRDRDRPNALRPFGATRSRNLTYQ